MITCLACGHANADDAAQCAACGAPLQEDLLDGLTDVLPLPAESHAGCGLAPGTTHPLDDTEREAASLLHSLATQPAPLGRPQGSASPRRDMAPSPALRRLLYLLVLLAALAPLAGSDLTSAWVQPRPQVAQLAETLARLPAGARVLVAVDYAPAYSGELDAFAEAVLADLTQRGVMLAALSTQPEGVGIARRVLSRAASTASDYRYAADYVVLGFVPGEERGLRLLAQELGAVLPRDDVLGLPLEQLPALQSVRSLADFDALLLVTDEADRARRWIEQITTQVDTPTYALATARVEPLLVPYRHSGQLAGLVGGAYGALEYPVAHRPPRPGLQGTDGQLALWAVFAATATLAVLGRSRHGKEGH